MARLIGTVSSGRRRFPDAPTIGTATDVGTGRAYNNGAATVTFTAPSYNGGLPVTSYTVTSSPGGFTASGASSPLTVTGLASNTAYTFTVTATNSAGTSSASSASNSITATTVPQTPSITSASRTSNTVVSIAFSGATGGKTITAVTATSSPSVSITSSGTTSPMTATATYTLSQAYTFTITATNANGTSSASAASSSVTPNIGPTLGAWSTSTAYPSTAISNRKGTSNGTYFYNGTGYDSGGNVSATSYTWDGGSWVTRAYPIARAQVSWGALDASNVYGVGGYNSLGNATADGYYANNTSQNWTTGTALPGTSINAQGARTSDGYIVSRGEQSFGAYYRTSTSGSWATSTSSPVSGGNALEKLGSSAYFISANSNTNIYSIGSVTGTYTSVATNPQSAIGQPHPVWANISDSRIFLFQNNDSLGTGTYLFNGSTFVASTAVPSGFTNNWWCGGAIGSNMSMIPSSVRTYTTHYVATLSS